MADVRAIGAVSQAVLQLLRSRSQDQDFGHPLEFRAFTAKDFDKGLGTGVSLFLYRVFPNGAHRTPPAPPRPGEGRFPTLLPLDLHFMLTVWGKQASLQHHILGWMMRVLEDHPIFPAAFLNAVIPGSFRPEETVEVSLTELTNEDLLRIWDTLVQNVYQLSVPYVARVVRIEAQRPLEEGGDEVQERVTRAAELQGPGGEEAA